MRKIYIDVFFFLNFAADFISLYTMVKILSRPLSILRVTLGAALGSAWSILFLFYPILRLINIPVASFIVLSTMGKRKWMKGVLVFIVSEALLGGIIICVTSLFSFLPTNGVKFCAVIIFSVLMVLVFGKAYEGLIRKKLVTTSVTATLTHRQKKEKVCLMIDSGNLARESLTGRMIIFIKESSISSLTGERDEFMNTEKIFPIPIKTASGSGIKYGFIPDALMFSDKKYNKGEFIVVPDTTGCEFGGYDGIIGVL